MKNLLVLGAGVDQVPLIKKAKKRHTVIAVSPSGYEGLKIADKSVNIDVRDKKAVLSIAKKNNVDGIVTDQLDIAVPTVAYVAERLDLPGNSFKTARLFTNKYLMRQKCGELDIPSPRFDVFSRHEGALSFAQSVGFPVVIKPVDNTGSRGVQIIHHKGGFKGKFAKSLRLSKCGNVIVEEFISGDEYMSQGFVESADPYIFAFAERFKFDLEGTPIFNRTIFSEDIPDNIKAKMNEYHSAIIKDARPNFGCTMAEWIYSEKTDEVYLVEAAIRGAGVKITSDLIPHAYGVDPQQYLLRHALGENAPKISKVELERKAAGYLTFLLPEGKVAEVDGVDEITALHNVDAATIDLEVSDTSGPICHKGSRNGPVLVYGESKKEVLEMMDHMEDILTIKVENSCGMQNAIFS
jgi:carbamoyl-phosphate synthase large subunit